jgi:hypothetical protein
VRRLVRGNGVSIADFNYYLALSLISSANNPNLHHVLVSCRQSPATVSGVDDHDDMELQEFVNGEGVADTLLKRLENAKWPKRYVLNAFTNNTLFKELRLTHNSTFRHVLVKLDIEEKGSTKRHCVLCRQRQTCYGCGDCNVILCQALSVHLAMRLAVLTAGTAESTWQKSIRSAKLPLCQPPPTNMMKTTVTSVMMESVRAETAMKASLLLLPGSEEVVKRPGQSMPINHLNMIPVMKIAMMKKAPLLLSAATAKQQKQQVQTNLLNKHTATVISISTNLLNFNF